MTSNDFLTPESIQFDPEFDFTVEFGVELYV